MKDPNLQLILYGPNAGTLTYSVTYPGVKLVKAHKVENPNYAFLDLTIAPGTKAGTLKLIGKKGDQTVMTSYELKARTGKPKGLGVSSADLVYLLIPDRFSNADESNDKFAGMADPNADRKNPFYRHGGDLQGIINHLDYLKELGVTALWTTPILENDQPLTDEGDSKRAAYHGYAFTDHYSVDRRFGGNEAYLKLVQAAHAKGIKVVQDAVYNHVGINHWFVKDLPMKDWIHQWPAYTGTSHKNQVVFDPYASQFDKKLLLDGWFVPFMADLNHNNPYVANFLIQHALWTVETFGVDAWRIDTYLYNELGFMNRCNQALITEYPHIHIFGEAWVSNVISQAYFVRNKIEFPFKSNMPGALDFQLYSAVNDALREGIGGNDGADRVHQTLAQDAVYQKPLDLVTFLDNHDTDRFFSVIGENYNKYRIGLTWLLTTRGIPTIYYGTEILMKNFKNPSDAEVRRDFPGGFAGDKENKFTAEGRSKRENEAFDFVKTLANYRQKTPVLQSGKLMQFVPQDGLYVYFRYNENQSVMVVTNVTNDEKTLETGRFAERMKGFSHARNVLNDETLPDLKTVRIPARTALVLELGK